MKKLTTLALAALMLAPASSFAESFTKVVTSGKDLKTALNGLGTGIEGETYEIICDWDAADKQSVGRIKPSLTKGRLIIKSNQTDPAKRPQVTLSFQWQADGVRAEAGKNLSIILENLVIDANKDGYFIDHRRAMFADTIAIRNCEVFNFNRSCLRFDGDRNTDTKDENGVVIPRTQMSIDVIDIRESSIHSFAQNSDDRYSLFRTFMPVNLFNIENCIFYDAPHTKSLWETRDVNENPTALNFNNNLVLLAQNKALAATGFVALNPGANVAPGSQFSINNNVLLAPRAGLNILKNDTTDYPAANTKLVSVSGAIVMATGNVLGEAYIPLEELTATLAAQEVPTTMIAQATKSLAEYPDFSWETGKTFQDASKDIYYMLKSNPWYTAGVVDPSVGANNSYVGASIAYVDEFPTPVAVNITVNGPEYVTYTISPVKEQYYKGDEVTVSFNDCNTYYRTMTNFKGWNDGNTEATRTFVLEGDLDATASFEAAQGNVISFFSFAGAITDSVYKADIYYKDEYRAEVFMMAVDTTMGATAPYNYFMASTDKTFTKNDSTFSIAQDMQFQSRAAKFAEDVVEMQMPIITRRSSAAGHTAGQPNYAMFKINGKGLSDIKFSCYTGTDNFMYSTQLLEYSIDGGKTWTQFASVDMTDAKRDADFGGKAGYLFGFKELAGTLPADANGKEEVYVRVISDTKSTPLTNPAAGTVDPTVGDTHEYIGQVLITATIGAGGIEGAVAAPVQTELDPNAPIYDLTGRQVSNPVKGIYLQNGKKFIVK